MEPLNPAAFATALLSLPDRRMRAFVLGEKLSLFSETACDRLLEDSIDGALRNDSRCLALLFSFVDLLEPVFQPPVENKMRVSSLRSETTNKTLRLFLKPPAPHKFVKRGEVHVTDQMMDYLPLGVKRSFAKKMDKNLIRRMVFEKDPYVIRHLLANPLTTEKDVLKICSNRPTAPDVIRVVYGADKWVQAYQVKEAILKNPYSPFRIALLMLFYMKRSEVETVSRDMTLHPELRAEADKMRRLRS